MGRKNQGRGKGEEGSALPDNSASSPRHPSRTSRHVASKSSVYHGSATSPLCPACASSSEHFPSGSPPQMRCHVAQVHPVHSDQVDQTPHNPCGSSAGPHVHRSGCHAPPVCVATGGYTGLPSLFPAGCCGSNHELDLPAPTVAPSLSSRYSAIGLRQILPWQTKSIFIIFLYLHLSLVFLLKHLIFQGFPTFEFSFLFKVSSQIFSYFLMFFPAILVNSLVKQASLPTGFFNYSLSDILLPLHHQNLHGCKCSRLH